MEGIGDIEIVLANEKLYARQEGAFYFELRPISRTVFDLKGPTAKDYMEFQFSKDGKITHLTPILEKDGWWSNIIRAGTYFKQ